MLGWNDNFMFIISFFFQNNQEVCVRHKHLTLMWWTLQGKQYKKTWQPHDWMVKIAAIYWVPITWQGFPGVSGWRICLPVQETWVWSPVQEDPLEKEMAAHSSIFACKIPWTKEPDRLMSMRLQRAGLDLATEQHHQHPMAGTWLGGFLFWFGFCLGRHPVTCGILVPRPRMEPVPPPLGVWSLNYKEIPLLGVLRFIISVSLWVTA